MLTKTKWHEPIAFIDLKSQYARIKPQVDARIQAVLDHGQYIMGPEVGELETRLAQYTGAKHAVGVADGTTALLVALMALQVRPGDEVITTPFTFIATGEMISLLGAVPVFVDIDPATYNIDPVSIEAAITPKTKAIIAVSLYGQCADFDAINAIAAQHQVPVIDDAAQSFGAMYNNRHSCSLATISCTSFFPSKPLGCYGDAGACFTDDAELAVRMRQIRLHGQEKRYVHAQIGLNGRMDTMQAAVLLAKLDVFDEEVALRATAGAHYSELIRAADNNQTLVTPVIRDGNTSVFAQYTVRVRDRATVVDGLKEAGIPTAVHYPVCLHKQPAYQTAKFVAHQVDRAEQAAEQVISLPMYPGIDPKLQQFISDALVDVS